MIFKPELARKVASGEKTETRRPMVADKPSPYVVGNDYAVQPGRGKFAIARVKILLCEPTFLGAMTPEQAAAEGFLQDTDGERHGDIAAFRAYWERLYGDGTARVDVRVWRIGFALVEAAS